MRTSNLLLATLKETPADAEIISHQLMLRAGLIRKLSAGLYTWLPTGLKVLRKVEKIVREEMDAIGAQELLMPAVQPAELWQETGRWEQFGALLLRITDNNQREFCFGPTHEEVITDIFRREVSSYKQLPLCFYQIQTKFRDEIRPRFGVMRAREFLMKDAYSFHTDAASMQATYEDMYRAYSNIFSRLGLKFRAVLADSGNIGGSMSHEFHVLAESGEDVLAISNESDYAANVERAETVAATNERSKAKDAMSLIATPGIKSVAAQAEFMQLETKQILKTMLVKGSETEVVALLLRGDHQLNPVKVEKLDAVHAPLTLVDENMVKNISGTTPGFVGPIGLNVPIIADHAVKMMANFSCGANKDDYHHLNVNWQRDLPEPQYADLRQIETGDPSPDGKGTISLTRGIEVGHIFQLGDKYSKQMKAHVLDSNGKAVAPLMGCYGIGVSRIVAAAIEQNHDDNGIIWPEAMAPFKIALIPLNYQKSDKVKLTADELYDKLINQGAEVICDDRNERPGVKFSDMELIGVPHWLIIGDKTLADNKIEYKNRNNGDKKLIDIAELPKFLQQL